jgi:hypothetical protein
MGDTGLPARLIGGANAIPDHVGYHWRPMIADNYDFKTISQCKMRRLENYSARGQGNTEGKREHDGVPQQTAD